MSTVIADISMSLDGYVTGPGAGPDNGLGIDGEGIHGWVLEEPRSPVDEAVLADSFESTGAVVMGRRLFDVVDGPNGWNDDVGYGHDQDQAAAPTCFVVTHEPPAHVRLESRFQFVTGGVGGSRRTGPSSSRATRTSSSWAARTSSTRAWRNSWSTSFASISRPSCSVGAPVSSTSSA